MNKKNWPASFFEAVLVLTYTILEYIKLTRRQTVKACCGKKALIIYFDHAFNKGHLDAFNKYGFVSPQQYSKAGILFLKKDTLTITGTFGSKHVNVRCGGQQCPKYVDDFEKIAEKILTS